MKDRITPQFGRLVKTLEVILALAVLVGVGAYAVGSTQVLIGADWTTSESFYELIYRVLLLVIGVELVRMLVVHDLLAVLELLAFVIARKMLKPDLVSVDILLVVTAFVALMWARRYIAPSKIKSGEEPPKWEIFDHDDKASNQP
jgi:hypothetical protein